MATTSPQRVQDRTSPDGGGAENDFLDGGFDHDRLNGGAGGDKFVPLAITCDGADWIQGYSATAGDQLLFRRP